MGLIVVSNRVASPTDGAAPGGLAAALLQGLRQSGGTWFGWSGKTVDNPADAFKPKVESTDNADFVTVDYPTKTFEGFYNGMANGALWPIMHNRPDLMVYDESDFAAYAEVNRRMAESLTRFVKMNSIIWVHDYHFMMLGHYLRERGVTHPIGFFFHTPFASHASLECLPQHRALCERLLAYDLIGFQTQDDLAAFEEYAVSCLGAVQLQQKLLAYGDNRVRLAVVPVGIDVDEYVRLAEVGELDLSTAMMRRALTSTETVIGVDRLDYSKGIPQRFAAYDRLLADNPGRKERTQFLQIAPPSRSDIAAYQQLRNQLVTMAGDINARWSSPTWTPIRFINEGWSPAALASFYRASRVCCVTPLRDGMNLVAKEYVAAQDPENPGVLILSKFAGAAHELDAALIVNPYDVAAMARALERGLSMSLGERRERWSSMMAALRRHDVAAWCNGFVAQLKRTRAPDQALVKIA